MLFSKADDFAAFMYEWKKKEPISHKKHILQTAGFNWNKIVKEKRKK